MTALAIALLSGVLFLVGLYLQPQRPDPGSALLYLEKVAAYEKRRDYIRRNKTSAACIVLGSLGVLIALLVRFFGG